MNRADAEDRIKAQASPMRTHIANRRASAAIGSQLASTSRRRLLRRASLYCGTNGCASFLDVDPIAGMALCRICGFRRPA